MTINEHHRPTTRQLAEQWAVDGRDPVRIEVVNLLRRAAARTTEQPNHVLAEHGLTRGQFDVLAALHRARSGAPLSQSELAEQMMVTAAGMKKRLDGLYDRGVIARTSDSGDARRHEIHLTGIGARLVDDVLDDFFAAESDALDALDDTALLQLTQLLRRLVRDPL